MKLQFKKQPFQLDAVSAIADIFQGQDKQTGIRYMADPGRPAYNFSIEMETGTGKTYTYIRTIMELNKRYGWL